MKRGDLATLSPKELAVSEQLAKSKKWTIGSPVTVQLPDGTTSTFTVGAIYDRRDVLGNVVIPAVAYTPHAPQNLDQFAFIKLKPGTSIPRVRTRPSR